MSVEFTKIDSAIELSEQELNVTTIELSEQELDTVAGGWHRPYPYSVTNIGINQNGNYNSAGYNTFSVG